jgi:phytoene dehydrogenase-like protein
MSKKIIIVGAGVAGLSAGCFARMNGVDVEIFEKHKKPGGLCTSWKRNGYIFDGCIEFLVGTNPKSGLHNLWKAVGAFEGKEIIDHDFYMQIEGDSGKKITLYSDVDRLQEHLIELSPADAEVIGDLTDTIRSFSMPGITPQNSNRKSFEYANIKELIDKFKDPFIKESLSFDNLGFLIMTLGFHSMKDAGYPIGGSLEFAKGIEKRFIDLGGSIRYRSEIDEVVIENDRASGVKLNDGTVFPADYIVSAADGHQAIFRLLKGKYISDEIEALFRRGRTSPTSIQVSLGIDYDLSDEPHMIYYMPGKTYEIAGENKTGFLFKHYCYDKTLSPAGKSVVTSNIFSDYGYWANLAKDRSAYLAEKEKVESAIIEVFEQRFPNTKGKVEVVDVATPTTYERYTNAWKGAYMGWLPTAELSTPCLPATLPGLDAFYMIGQWTSPGGGLPPALITAHRCVASIGDGS